MTHLAPFWRYYGGKNRAARLYPQPEHDTIIEPFAGAAGYSCRYPDRKVILVDKYPVVVGVWRYLIATPAAEIRALPDLPESGEVEDLPASLPEEARWLIGLRVQDGRETPRSKASSMHHDRVMRGILGGWHHVTRESIASQVDQIRHWQVIEGDYRDAPDIEATWHVDPPYNNRAGRCYPHQPDDFAALGEWCRARRGLVMVCENAGADWLPFEPLRAIRSTQTSRTGRRSVEVIWLNRPPRFWGGVQTGIFRGGL